MSSSSSSETLEEALKEMNGWKRNVELELSTQFDRVKSLLGRIDRAKRKDSTSQDPPGDAQGALPEFGDLNDQGNLNRILAQRFHGVT